MNSLLPLGTQEFALQVGALRLRLEDAFLKSIAAARGGPKLSAAERDGPASQVHFERALDLLARMQAPSQTATVSLRVAAVERELGNYDRALELARKTDVLARNLHYAGFTSLQVCLTEMFNRLASSREEEPAPAASKSKDSKRSQRGRKKAAS